MLVSILQKPKAKQLLEKFDGLAPMIKLDFERRQALAKFVSTTRETFAELDLDRKGYLSRLDLVRKLHEPDLPAVKEKCIAFAFENFTLLKSLAADDACGITPGILKVIDKAINPELDINPYEESMCRSVLAGVCTGAVVGFIMAVGAVFLPHGLLGLLAAPASVGGPAAGGWLCYRRRKAALGGEARFYDERRVLLQSLNVDTLRSI